MCRTNNFCYFWSLRTGALVAAAITFMVGVVFTVIGILYIYDPSLIGATRHNHVVVGGLFFTMGSMALVTFVLMILALTQKKAGFLLPWIVCTLFQVLLFSMIIIFLVSTGVFLALLGFFAIAFIMYIWIDVHSYYLIQIGGYDEPLKW